MAAAVPVPFQAQPVMLFAIHRTLLLAGRMLTFSTHSFEHSPYLDAFKVHELARIVLPSGVPASVYALKLFIIAAIVTVAVVLHKATKTKKAKSTGQGEGPKWLKEQVAMPMVMALMVSSALQVTALMLFGHDTCAVPPHNIMDFVLLMVACCFALMAAIKMDGGQAKRIKSLHISAIVAAGIAIAWFAAYLLAFVGLYAAERGMLAAAYTGLKDKVASPSASVLTYLLALTPKSLMTGLVKDHVLMPCLVAGAAAILCVIVYLGAAQEEGAPAAEKRSLRKRVHTLMLGLLLSLTLLAAVISYAYSFDRS